MILTTLAEERNARIAADLTVKTIFELTDDVVFLLGSDKRVQWMSPRAARLMRVDIPHAVGKPMAQIVDNPGLNEAIDRSLASGRSNRVLARVGAEELEMEARIVPIAVPSGEKQKPRIHSLIVSLSEVELEKRLQSMRREFVANVSHELRSPLTSILGYVETLLHDPPEDPEKQRRFLVGAVREARRMQRLVEDLLQLSRIESGRALPQFQWSNLHNIIGRVLTQLRNEAERARVTLSNTVPPELRLECDPGQIEQVVYNLVINGIHYTPPGGRVTVDGFARGDTVSLTVSDTGLGIPAADLPHIFERFYRVDKARSRATGATGLGLSIVKHIVDAHNGTVSVDSDRGGTTFTVELPTEQTT